MGQGARLPLNERRGPGTPPPAPAPEPSQRPTETASGANHADDRPAAHAAVEPPPGTPCWLNVGSGTEVGGVVLGWQQNPDGAWWALISAWVPRDDVRRR